MPRDNHPRDRQRAKVERKAPTRPLGRRILVVCEGRKSEPTYLLEMRQSLRIPAANLFVTHEGVTDPRQIVDAAWQIFQNGKGVFRPKAADVVLAVFDRDEHRGYHDAISHAELLDSRQSKNDERRPVRVLAVPSNSCFELWLLLHFKDIQTPIHRHDAYKQLKAFIPEYDKGMDSLFSRTRADLPVALRRAYRLATRFDLREDGPCTAMHLLVHLLLDPGLPLPNFPVPFVGDFDRIGIVEEFLRR